MPTNDFKPFATGAGANVMSQADWVALAALASGFQSGKASSAQINKALRQASFISAAIAQYTADKSGQNVLDDGDISGFVSKMHSAFGADFQPLDATLTAIAGLATGANKLPYFTGTDTAAQTDFTTVGRDIVGKSAVSDVLTYLGIGTAGTKNVGTGTGQIPDMSFFSSSLITNGFKNLPGGLVIQWGSGNTTTGGATVTYPVAFSNACLSIVGNENSNGVSPVIINFNSVNKTSFQVFAWSNTGTAVNSFVRWIAIGY